MHYLLLILKVLFYTYLGYLLFFLAAHYHPAEPGFSPPFVLWVVDTINLFIHEAGHFFFKPFGMFVHILAGSAFQVMIPLALLVVTWRQNMHHIALPAFWVGESMVNVSAYIADAPYRKLKLIAKGLIHDWHWLLSGSADVAEPLSYAVFGLGLLLCLGGVGAGVFFAVRTYRQEAAPHMGAMPPP